MSPTNRGKRGLVRAGEAAICDCATSATRGQSKAAEQTVLTKTSQ